MTAPSYSDTPAMSCPKCGHVEPDYDGFGMLYCERCGYCTHPSITDDVCEVCERKMSADGRETLPGRVAL